MSKAFNLIHNLAATKIPVSEEVSSTAAARSWNSAESTRGAFEADPEILSLVHQLFLTENAEAPKVVLFAGIEHGSGCTHIVTSVAKVLSAAAGRSVCLVEANLRSPVRFGGRKAVPEVGLTDALTSAEPLASFVQEPSKEAFWRLAPGAIGGGSSTLLASDRLRERVAELRKSFEYVLVDAAPLNQYADALALGQLSDGVVLVLEANSTRREAATVVADRLRALHIRILAGVLNKRTFPIPEKLYNLL